VRAQRQDDPRSGIQRRVNLIGRLTGFRSLAVVRTAFPAGIDPRDAAWIWRRLLDAVGAAHRAGVIHGAVLPEHVMIHPAEHPACGDPEQDWPGIFEEMLGAPFVLRSYGPTVAGKRTSWPRPPVYQAAPNRLCRSNAGLARRHLSRDASGRDLP
jgi:hypothetical protein